MITKEQKCTSEKKIEKYLKDQVAKRGGITIKQTSQIGLPDRLVILPDCPPFFVECKSSTGVLSLSQKGVIARLEKMGQVVFVVKSYEAVDQLISWKEELEYEN